MEQDLYVYGSSAFVTYKFLFDRKVPESTVYNSTSKKNKDQWHVRTHPANKRIKLIYYSSIPLAIIEKYNLPNFAQLKEMAELIPKRIDDYEKEKASKHIKAVFDLEYDNWREIESLYKNEFVDETKIERFCKTHLLFSKAIELNSLGFKLRDIFNVYKEYDDLVFDTQSYYSFCKKLRKIKKSKCIEDELLHGLKHHLSNNLKIIEDVVLEIKRLFADPKKYSSNEILKQVNDYLTRLNRKRISLSAVQKVIAQPYIKNETMISRFGNKYTEDHLLPFAHFTPPNKEGSLWLLDGTRFQFAYKTDDSNYNFLIYFVILDGCSKKIVGYSYDDSENSEMVTEALKRACINTGYLPREIITDNSIAYKSKDFTRIIAYLKEWGVNWRTILASNPRDNSYVERFFGVFQESFCKKCDGYLGDGIKSRNINGKPSPEEIEKFNQKEKLRTKSELESLLDKLIDEYNNSDKIKAFIAKNQFETKMGDKKILEPIPFNTIKLAQLFWHSKEITMNHSSIVFDIDSETYEYNLYDEEIILAYNGTKVRVRYEKGDLSKIMLFNLNSDEYITTLEKFARLPKHIDDRSDEDNAALQDHIEKKKKLKIKLKNRIKETHDTSENNREKLPPQITEYTNVRKEQKEDTETEMMKDELQSTVGVEKMNIITLEQEDDDFDQIFKNLYGSN